jgi:hypothetical protein
MHFLEISLLMQLLTQSDEQFVLYKDPATDLSVLNGLDTVPWATCSSFIDTVSPQELPTSICPVTDFGKHKAVHRGPTGN